MPVYGIEKSLRIDLALQSFGIHQHLDEASGQLLGVERSLMQRISIVEIELFRDFLDSGVQQNVAAVEDDDRIDDVLEVADLVRGDDDGRIFGSIKVAEDCLYEWLF